MTRKLRDKRHFLLFVLATVVALVGYGAVFAWWWACSSWPPIWLVTDALGPGFWEDPLLDLDEWMIDTGLWVGGRDCTFWGGGPRRSG